MTKIIGDIWVEKSIFIPCADWICWEFLANFWLVLSAGITAIALWTMGLWPDPVLPCRGNFRFNRKFREFPKFPVQPEILAILRVKILIIWEPSGLIWEPSEHHFMWPAAMFSSQITNHGPSWQFECGQRALQNIIKTPTILVIISGIWQELEIKILHLFDLVKPHVKGTLKTEL